MNGNINVTTGFQGSIEIDNDEYTDTIANMYTKMNTKSILLS